MFEFENSNLDFEIWWAYYTDLPDHVHQKIFKTMKSSLRYGSCKFALQKLDPTDLEGKCEFEWPQTAKKTQTENREKNTPKHPQLLTVSY